MNRIFPLFLLLATIGTAEPLKKFIDAGNLYTVIPMVADGGYWKTTVTIANMEKDKSVVWSLKFFSEDGKALELPIVGQGRRSVLGGVLPLHGSITVETEGNSKDLAQGWAKLEGSGADNIGAIVIFGTHSVPNRPDFEAVVPVSFSLQDYSIYPFDNTNGYISTMAWVNSAQYGTSTMTATVYDEIGKQLSSEQFTLKPGQRQAFTIAERFPVAAGRRGTVLLSGSLESFSVLGLRFNPAGAFTSVHTLDGF